MQDIYGILWRSFKEIYKKDLSITLRMFYGKMGIIICIVMLSNVLSTIIIKINHSNNIKITQIHRQFISKRRR